MFPNCEGPVPQLWVEKSSVKDVNDERVLVFSLLSEFVLMFSLLFVLRLATFEFELFELLLAVLLFVTLAMAKTRITSPIPTNTSTAPIPRIHGQTLRFWAAGGGMGDQGGWAGGGGGGGTDCCGLGV